MSLTLHLHPLSSYCWKVLIALYENETSFTAHTVNLGDPTEKAAFTALWPTTKIPLLQDGDRVIPETSIMIEYLDRHYPGRKPLLPANADTRLEARLWDRLFDSYVMAPMQDIVTNQLLPESERSSRRVNHSKAMLQMAYDMIEKQLAGKTWAVSDDFSIADCAASPSLFYASILVPFSASHARLSDYFERLLVRPSFARARKEAQPYFKYFPFRELMPARFIEE